MSTTMSVATLVVDEYKRLEAFKNDAIEVKADAYIFNFNDCKEKVARAYPNLDPSGIITDRATPEEGGEGAIVEDESVWAKG